MIADGVEVTRASGLLLRRTETPSTARELPPITPPEDLEPDHFPGAVEDRTKAARASPTEIELRWASRGEDGTPPTAWIRFPFPIIDGEESTPLMRAAAMSDFANRMSQVARAREVALGDVPGGGTGFINTDMTLYIHRDPVDEWLAITAFDGGATMGIGTADMCSAIARASSVTPAGAAGELATAASGGLSAATAGGAVRRRRPSHADASRSGANLAAHAHTTRSPRPSSRAVRRSAHGSVRAALDLLHGPADALERSRTSSPPASPADATDVLVDRASRLLFATDASIYQMEPVAVVFPRSADGRAARPARRGAARRRRCCRAAAAPASRARRVNHAIVIDCSRYMDRSSR